MNDHNLNEFKKVYYFEPDEAEASAVCAQLELFGYHVSRFSVLKELHETFEKRSPDAIMMHLTLENATAENLNEISQLQQSRVENFPIIFISDTDSLAERIQTVKAGGAAFFMHPLDIGALVDSLDNLTQMEPVEKYRVLIIDDSIFQARMFARLLEQQGVICQLMSDPMLILQQIVDFNPDLVLLDMYMPQYSGLELAKVIRQMEKFDGLPIVYLSSETNKEKQLQAMKLGGDDFLDKTIAPDHFYSAISARIERYRKLRSLMTRDSLTGLTNHTLIIDRLTQEMQRAQRNKTLLSFVMIDLDHFKQVNDQYGHPAGDRVIKSLARLLKQKLRSSDIIGRYGGEEFAIVMPETNPAVAVKVINELRLSFANLQHKTDAGEFWVTFSAGVATFPRCKLPVEIGDAADKALYMAKRGGRNQVVLLEV